MKITLIARREWEHNSYKGLSFDGFTEGGDPITFTTSQDREYYPEEVKFNPAKAEEIELKTSIFDGKVKYQEANSRFS